MSVIYVRSAETVCVRVCAFATCLNVCVVSLLYVMEFGCLIVADI